MKSPLRYGIIGCGVIAPTHLESFARQDNMTLAWACDLIEGRASAMAERFGAENIATDYAEVLADPSLDCVSICTDHASHAPIAAAALQAGKHVLCEKALAASIAGLSDMFEAHSQNSNLVFSGIFQHRFDASQRCLKSLVEEGVFGQILTAGVQVRCLRTDEYYHGDPWRGTWAEEGGAVLINQAIHFIDQLVWIMDGVDSLCGTHCNLTHRDSMETEDTAVASLRFRSGALGIIEATCSSHIRWEPTLSIHGTAGSIDLRHGQPVKIAFENPSCQEEVISRLAECRDNPGAQSSKSYYGTGHVAQISDFVDAIRQGRPPFVEASSARHTVEVVLGIYQSHREGGWVKISH